MDLLQIVTAALLLAGNFFFVAVEFSITRARPTMVDELVRERAGGAGSLRHGVENLDNYLSACQLGITVCSIGLGITAEPLVSDLLKSVIGVDLFGLAAGTVAFLLAYGLVSMFHVVLGELAPKSLAIARTRRTGLLLLPPMRIFYFLTKPVVDLFNWLGNLVLRPFGIPPASEAGTEPHTERELEALLAESEGEGMIEPEELQFASGAFRFGDRRAHQVMVSRQGAVTLSSRQGLRDAALTAANSGHRRFPLCDPERGLDAPLGLVHLNDLTRALAENSGTDLSSIARPLVETSDATLLDDLLEELRGRRENLALVRDEHGTAVGIVTLEDIIEEVIGDIRDEFDPRSEPPIERSEDGCRVGGEAHLHYLERELELDFGEHRQGTIGGYLVERLGHVPTTSEEVHLEGAVLRPSSVEGTRVAEVMIRRAEEVGADDAKLGEDERS